MTEVRIPYTPRYPQTEIHERLESHRFSVLVAHRRLGKTVLAVNHILKQALLAKRPYSRYAYVAPFRKQAKTIAWQYFKHFARPLPGTAVNESDLELTLLNGSKISLIGADNPDSLRGGYLDGCVLDEVAQMRRETWGEIVRPMLADRHGWAVFVGTPKGINLFSQAYDRALKAEAEGDTEWCAMMYPVTQTHVIPPAELESLRADMSENEWRQEFLCDFNAEADDALIPIDVVRAAAGRHYHETDYSSAPVVLGVDVARFGGDASVIFPRQGLVAFEPTVIHGIDNMRLADTVAAAIAKWHPTAVFVDQGNGTGVIDRLRQLGHRIQEVPFGAKALDDHFANRRAEMWWGMKAWLEAGGAIPQQTVLQADLCAPTYGFNPSGKRVLEKKEDIKLRLGRSPDLGDALALTFAAPVIRSAPLIRQMEYDPFADF